MVHMLVLQAVLRGVWLCALLSGVLEVCWQSHCRSAGKAMAAGAVTRLNLYLFEGTTSAACNAVLTGAGLASAAATLNITLLPEELMCRPLHYVLHT